MGPAYRPMTLASGRRGHVQHEGAATALTPATFHRPSTAFGPAPVTFTDRTAISSHRGARESNPQARAGYGVITMATEFWPTLIGFPVVLVAVLIGVTVLGPG
jgi:hypothetical protein